MTTNAVTQVRYRIIETIGRGGMGEVCLADDLILHRQVALKFVGAPGDSDVLDQLLREARAAAGLDHPFICSIYEVTTITDRPCIAMEYVRGETLERRLRRGPMPLTEGLHVAEEVAEALEAAHKRRVIHRDLKPANVILTEDGHIKVMDFGLATRLPVADGTDEGMTMSAAAREVGVVRGTPAYMAPEQIRGEAVDRRSDIFSCGILLYELLSGINPFDRGSIHATLAAILDGSVVALHDRISTVPAAVGAVVARMLARDPSSRYQSFGDVRIDLRRLAADVAPPSVRSGAPMVVERLPRDGSSGLIGRDAERAQLLQSITEAAAGRGTVIVLNGEAGIGKSRLAQDALQAARRLGCQTFVGRCHEQAGMPPLIAYIEVLEEASRLMPGPIFRRAVEPSAPEIAKLLPELHRLFPDMEAPLELPPELRQRFLFTNIREFLARCARVRPIVIFLDDMQWADDSTVQLTRHLAEHLPSLPIVIIAACRDVDPQGPVVRGTLQSLFERVRGQRRGTRTPQAVKEACDDLVRRGEAKTIALRAFSEVDVRGMLTALAGEDPPSRLVRRFLDQTGGNPFFVGELFRHLKEEGRLFDAHNRWKRELGFDDHDIPDSVRVVLERRLQRISSHAREVLTAAAVIGRQFELDLVQAVAGVGNDELITTLDEAEQARLVRGPSGRQQVAWGFAHEMIRQALAAALPPLGRQRLHLRIADAMERAGASAGRTYAAEIAHHLYSAGHMADRSRTAHALMGAGDAAYVVYATEDAIRHYRRALEVLDEPAAGDQTRHRIEERLADLLALLGDREAALEHYRALAGVHETRSAAVDRARIVRKLGTLHWQEGNRGQAMECYHHALGIVDPSSAPIESAHLYQELGLAAFRTGDNAKAIEWAERALRVAEEALAGEPAVTSDVRREASAAVAHAANTIGVALARTGRLDEARAHIERSVSVARELGLLDVACRAYANLGVLYSTVEPQSAIDVSMTGLELAAKIGAASLQSYLYANLAAAYCALTDQCQTEGLQAAEAGANLDRALGQLDHLAVPLIVMAQIHQCQGELQKAQNLYVEALALAQKIGEPQLILPCYDGLATIYLDRGDKMLAERYMQQARDLCERAGVDPDALLLLPFLC